MRTKPCSKFTRPLRLCLIQTVVTFQLHRTWRVFFAYGIIRCLLYDDFLWPHIHLLVCNAYIYAFVRKWSCKPHKAGKNASIRGKKTHVYRVTGMIASIRWKKPHVDRVIILKQMADHRRRRLFCRSVVCK